MERIIKFRQYVKDQGGNDFWHYWGPLEPGRFVGAIGGYESMQYTGLKDKNGVEIYEGDVVRVCYDGELDWLKNGDDEVRVVEWGMQGPDEYYPAFDLKGHDMEINALSTAKNNGDIVVVGNIYQNPDLTSEPKN